MKDIWPQCKDLVLKNSEILFCHSNKLILFLSILGKKHTDFNDFSTKKDRNCREPYIKGVGFIPKLTSQLKSDIFGLAITRSRRVSVGRFIPCCQVQMLYFALSEKQCKKDTDFDLPYLLKW